MNAEPIQMMPEGNNFYASFKNVDKEYIKNIFIEYKWQCRKESWKDFELVNDWSELVLHGKADEPLIAGAVIFNPSNVDKLDAVFESIGGDYQYEFYNEQKHLLLERKNMG